MSWRFCAVCSPRSPSIGVFLECALNSLLAARVLARGAAAGQPLNLTILRLPEWLVWVLIPALALCWAPWPRVSTVALNAVLPLIFGYLLQGLSITLHLAVRARLSRFGTIMFASALVFFPWLLAAPLLLGLLDFRFDFRGRWPLILLLSRQCSAPAPGNRYYRRKVAPWARLERNELPKRVPCSLPRRATRSGPNETMGPRSKESPFDEKRANGRVGGTARSVRTPQPARPPSLTHPGPGRIIAP